MKGGVICSLAFTGTYLLISVFSYCFFLQKEGVSYHLPHIVFSYCILIVCIKLVHQLVCLVWYVLLLLVFFSLYLFVPTITVLFLLSHFISIPRYLLPVQSFRRYSMCSLLIYFMSKSSTTRVNAIGFVS